VIGGGSRNGLLNTFTAAATGLPVLAGPVEATAVGNILVQAMASGGHVPGGNPGDSSPGLSPAGGSNRNGNPSGTAPTNGSAGSGLILPDRSPNSRSVHPERGIFMNTENIRKAYEIAAEAYAEQGVDVEGALRTLARIPLSLHCWQGTTSGGSRAATKRSAEAWPYPEPPRKGRTADELRRDLDFAFALIPGPHRLNLHAIYGEFGGPGPDRDEIEPAHFRGWADWARERSIALDFNATCFSHPRAASGLTLSHPNGTIRRFWIDHVKACRASARPSGAGSGIPACTTSGSPTG